MKAAKKSARKYAATRSGSQPANGSHAGAKATASRSQKPSPVKSSTPMSSALRPRLMSESRCCWRA